jgi:hypothetical protein
MGDTIMAQATRSTRSTKPATAPATVVEVSQEQQAHNVKVTLAGIGGKFAEARSALLSVGDSMNTLAIDARAILGERKLKTFATQAAAEGVMFEGDRRSKDGIVKRLDSVASTLAVRRNLDRDAIITAADVSGVDIAHREDAFLTGFLVSSINRGIKVSSAVLYYGQIADTINDKDGVFQFGEQKRREAANADGAKSSVTVEVSKAGRFSLVVNKDADMHEVRAALRAKLNDATTTEVAAFVKVNPALYGIMKDIGNDA